MVPYNASWFRNGIFADDQVKMRSLGCTLIQDPYKKGAFGSRCPDVQTGRVPCDGEGGVGGDASASQGTRKIARKLPDTSREAWGRVFLTTLIRGNWDMEGEPVQGSCCCFGIGIL